MPPGAGLMPPAPAGPPQVEGQAGVADEASGVLSGQACQAGGLDDGELDRGDAGRAGLAGLGGMDASPRGMPSSAALSCSSSAFFFFFFLLLLFVLLAAGRHNDAAAQGVADRGVAELSEGGEDAMAADRIEAAGLALVPSMDVLAGLERFLAGPPAPGLAMQTNSVIVAGTSCGAQQMQKVTWSGQETGRRISEKCPGLAVAISAQSEYRGPLEPFPHERRSKTASRRASSALITFPEDRVIRKSRGAIPTYGRPRSWHAPQGLLLRV